MRSVLLATALALSIPLAGSIGIAQAQQAQTSAAEMRHDHATRQAMGQGGAPALPGQDAFGAIQEIVRMLESDPATDWSKVSLERLRQHLIDMNDVTLRSEVKATVAPGGLVMDVTGAGRTEQAIRRMVGPHTAELNKMPEWSATTAEIPGGLRLTVVAKNLDDARTIARIRGLGFIGLLVQGAHHQPHHLAMASGQEMPAHGR
jgi:hypothetical protein